MVLPFLPGDSLLFVAGAVAAIGGMDLGILMVRADRGRGTGQLRSITPLAALFGERIVAAGRLPFIKPSAMAGDAGLL